MNKTIEIFGRKYFVEITLNSIVERCIGGKRIHSLNIYKEKGDMDSIFRRAIDSKEDLKEKAIEYISEFESMVSSQDNTSKEEIILSELGFKK